MLPDDPNFYGIRIALDNKAPAYMYNNMAFSDMRITIETIRDAS